MTLKDNYIRACNAYLKAFCEMYEFDFDSGFWVSAEVGTITEVSGYYFDMQVIIYCVDNDVPEKELLDWYDYNLDAHSFGFNAINLPSWMKCCPRKSEKEIEEIKAKRAEIDKMEKELIELCKDEN